MPKKIAKKGADSPNVSKQDTNKDDTFRAFRRLCTDVASVSAYTEKTAIVRQMFTEGSNGDKFKGDIVLWCRLLLPREVNRVYNLQSKQLIKLFARVLCQDEDEMLEHLEQGDIAETIRVFFENSEVVEPAAKSTISLASVDDILQQFTLLTKEEDQMQHIKSFAKLCTGNDLKMIIRLIVHDLRINAGAKHILEAVHPNAYEAFRTSRDLENVIKRCREDKSKDKVEMTLMTPVLPMLADACKSVEMAMKKCPNGMLAEVKYDGERVQVHKKGSEFRYFSRSLKPVVAHKVNLFKDFIPKAFPKCDDLILDSEVLMIDNSNGQPLPFGSLGIHKKAQFKDATVCLFIFDCLYYNGDVLLNRPIKERRKILETEMTPIKNRIVLSEIEEVHDPKDLAKMIARVLSMGLEGLVLKDMQSKYEPGKRHWLKVKKDYLFDGAMADTADLVVLGAWYGTGNKGGIMSIFLMGCYDEKNDKWVTVTKVHSGHDDATLTQLQTELDMIKIGKDPAKVPKWLNVKKQMIPDFVAKDPKKQPVWEITGAEFTNQGVHTADGISIRFPRVTRIRKDKDWATATNLSELKSLFAKSADSTDFDRLLNTSDDPKLPNSSKFKDQPKLTFDWKVKDEEAGSSRGSKRDRSDDFDLFGSMITKEKKPKKEDELCQQRAAYYAFINKDYIEYTADGVPLNWIDGREPPNGLPASAKPLSSRVSSEIASKVVLKDTRICLSRDFDASRCKTTLRALKTLGAILSKEDFTGLTHVVHSVERIPASQLQEFNEYPKSARQVNSKWVDECARTAKAADASTYAVLIKEDYCDCRCEH